MIHRPMRFVERALLVVGLSALIGGTARGQQDAGAAQGDRHGAQRSGAGSVSGIVIDSIHGGPLAGAQVMVEGVNVEATTDTGGRFRIAGVPPGAHRMGVFHPVLDSLGIGLSSPPLTVPAGDSIAVMFATPSAQSAVAILCRGASPGEGAGPSAVVGHVLDADTDEPMAGVRVSLSWVEIQASKKSGVHRLQRVRDTTTGPDGAFHFCYMPAGLNGTLRATPAGEASAITRPYGLAGQYIGFVVLHAASRPGAAMPAGSGESGVKGTAEAAGSGARPGGGGATLVGRVTQGGGAPLPGARALIVGGDSGVTGDSGQFTLRGLAPGTRTLIVRAVGWEPVSMPVELTTREPQRVTVSLGMKTAVLKAVLVTARLNAGLTSVGFAHRRQVGIGRFLTADDIQKRNAFDFHDLVTGMPGVSVAYDRSGRPVVRGARGNGSCVGYWIDGVPINMQMAGSSIDDWVRPSEIGGLEVYQASEGPVTYSRSPSGIGCVSMVIWTKTRLGL